MRNILLSGYYGFGNTGDEAILASLATLKKARPDLNIMVLSQHPDETSQLKKLSPSPKNVHWKVAEAIKKADLVVFMRGSLSRMPLRLGH